MGRLGPQHPGIGPAGGPLGRNGIGHRNVGRLQGVGLIRPGRPDHHVMVREQRDFLRGEVPVFLDQWTLLLEQVDGGVELRLRQLIGIGDAETGLRLHQVERGVRDLDRIVRHRHLPFVLAVVERLPAGGSRGELGLAVEENVRSPLQGDAVVDAVDGVERRPLELRSEILPVGDEVDVDRFDIATVNQPKVGIARGRHHVVLSAATVRHQRHHLIGRARVLGVDHASRLLLEGLNPIFLCVALPGDQVQLPFARSDRGRRFHAGGRRLRGGRSRTRGCAAARRQDHDQRESRHRLPCPRQSSQTIAHVAPTSITC